MKIKALTLQSADLAATVAFYGGLLGVPVLQQDDDRITFRIGDTEVLFTKAPAGEPVYHIAIDIPKNKLEEACDWLLKKTKVLPVTDGSMYSEFVNWNARSVYFLDNNGNIMELICRLDLDNASGKVFDASLFQHVSEIGIVGEDVPACLQQLGELYGLQAYAKQPPADNFSVMGDENGLLILVSEGRPWFPTTVAAKLFPLTVIFDAGNGVRTLQLGGV